jgi:hypothetical protein
VNLCVICEVFGYSAVVLSAEHDKQAFDSNRVRSHKVPLTIWFETLCECNDFNPNTGEGQQTGQGKVSIVIDIRTNMPVCAVTCLYPATYISCSQAVAVNTKRRLLHSYPLNCKDSLYATRAIG